MCQLCAFAARYPRDRQDPPVQNLSQFAAAIRAKAATATNPKSINKQGNYSS